VPKSNTSDDSRQVSRPDKPYEDFPLFPHASGRWAKKIRQKTHFFGRWGNSVQGKIVPVENTDSSAAAALIEFNRQWPYLSEGRTPPVIDAGDGCTVRDLCNAFLTRKQGQVDTLELSQYSFCEYQRTTDALMAQFGRNRRVDDLRPDDFEALRKTFAKGCGLVTLKSKINRARVVLKFASDERLIDRPVAYGGAFNRPSAKNLREARNQAGVRLFERNDLLAMLDALDGKPVTVAGEQVLFPKSVALKAMVLLGLNAGFGNNDVASLPRSSVNLETGWLIFPRPKTAINRKVPLWPETVTYLRQAMLERPAAVDEADADLCFITERGTRFVRHQPSGTEGRFVTISTLARRFEKLMSELKISGRKGLGFYTLRHVFQTRADEALDPVATSAIMGHGDSSMAAQYNEKLSDARLKAVTEVVRSWLFGAEGGAK
jgi:integrase